MNMQRVRAAKLPGAEVGEEVEQRSQVLWRRSELLALDVRHSYFIPRQALASLGELAYFQLFAEKNQSNEISGCSDSPQFKAKECTKSLSFSKCKTFVSCNSVK